MRQQQGPSLNKIHKKFHVGRHMNILRYSLPFFLTTELKKKG